jgi:hypothetical protein
MIVPTREWSCPEKASWLEGPDGIEIVCRSCGKAFRLCTSCWRGQRYCSEGCRQSRQVILKRARQSRYQQSPKGKESQARRSRRFRLKKIATDATTHPPPRTLITAPSASAGYCTACGEKVRSPVSGQRTVSLRRLIRAFARGSGRDPDAPLQ